MVGECVATHPSTKAASSRPEESCVLPSVLVMNAHRSQSDDDDSGREIWERTAYIDNICRHDAQVRVRLRLSLWNWQEQPEAALVSQCALVLSAPSTDFFYSKL